MRVLRAHIQTSCADDASPPLSSPPPQKRKATQERATGKSAHTAARSHKKASRATPHRASGARKPLATQSPQKQLTKRAASAAASPPSSAVVRPSSAKARDPLLGVRVRMPFTKDEVTRHYKGVVLSVLRNNRYVVRFDDGELRKDFTASELRMYAVPPRGAVKRGGAGGGASAAAAGGGETDASGAARGRKRQRTDGDGGAAGGGGAAASALPGRDIERFLRSCDPPLRGLREALAAAAASSVTLPHLANVARLLPPAYDSALAAAMELLLISGADKLSFMGALASLAA